MDANTIWARLDTTLRERGLTALVARVEPTHVDEHQELREGFHPSEDTVRALLPESYRRFVAAYGCPEICPAGLVDDESDLAEEDEDAWADWEDRVIDALESFEFLPYHGMRWATGVMAHPGREDWRAERARGEYRWEFVMFAASDAAEGCGWAFWPTAGESDGTGEPQVWYVEDSLPVERMGTFAEWLDGKVSEILAGLAGLGLVDALAAG